MASSRQLFFLVSFSVAIARCVAQDPASGTYPADPPADVSWPWSDWKATITTIENKFNDARKEDPTISVDLKIEYTQAQWDALSSNQKALYLSNKERIDRGIRPYAAVSKELKDVAEDFAKYLHDVEEGIAHNVNEGEWTGSGRSADACCGPKERIAAKPGLGAGKEFFKFSENLAWQSAGTKDQMPEPEALAIYNWIYDDSGSRWGHRHFSLAALNNNAGGAEAEGLLGFGVFQGNGETGKKKGSYEVMNVADEKATWDYASADNLYLWSAMKGGGANVGTPGGGGGGGGGAAPAGPAPVGSTPSSTGGETPPARSPQPPPPFPPPKATARTPYSASSPELEEGGVAAISTPTIFLGICAACFIGAYFYHPEWFSSGGGDSGKKKGSKKGQRRKQDSDSDSDSDSSDSDDSEA